MSFGLASWLRVLQMLPIPFCFIAITNAAYVGLPKEQSNQVSGIINFVRNIGGSIFIALTGALITNRSLFHQSRLDSSMNMSNTALSQHLNAVASRYGAITDSVTAMHQAQTQIYNQLVQQASGQSYQDIYRVLCWMSMAMVLCALLLSKNKPGEGAPAGEGMG
jgi:DHA2 family multidrug resistance protein